MRTLLKLTTWAAIGVVGWWSVRTARRAMDFYLWERELATSQEAWAQ